MRLLQPKTIGVFFCFLVLTLAFSSVSVKADQVDAQTAITSTKNILLNCFDAAKTAENAGANITSFINTLNDANTLLSNAEASYSENDFATAYSLALQSQNQLANFVAEINSVQNSAVKIENNHFWTAALSIAVAIAILAVGAVLWIYLGRKNKFSEGSL
jgi:maltodextrin utilization protein YvdJ